MNSSPFPVDSSRFDPFDPETLVALLAPANSISGCINRIGLLPILRWLALTAAPKHVVELGVGDGTSYLALCAALPPSATCIGVGPWNDDVQQGLIHPHMCATGCHSSLLHQAPERAAEQIADGSIDLLHIALDADVTTLERTATAWLPKISKGGVLALAGIVPQGSGHGAAELFAALAEKHPHIAFPHFGGVGLLLVGAEPPASAAWLVVLPCDSKDRMSRLFRRLGETLIDGAEKDRRIKALSEALEKEQHARQHALTDYREALERESALQQEVEHKQVQLYSLRMQINALHRSTSWRITAPLRGMRHITSRLREIPHRRQRQSSHDPKTLFKERMTSELVAFLESGERLQLPTSETPRLSIVIVLYNQAALTFACLKSLVGTINLPAEVILIDNASSDETGVLLDRLDGAQILRNTENLHFLRAVNQGAGKARGDSLLLLNNDACILPNTLSTAEETLYSSSTIGAVGGKIILLDGRLQEAGSIIWSDGSCLGYGRGRSPNEPEFQFFRDVDYCSGAFLLIKRHLFEDLGRLDMAFSPAYYEETDFCMRLRAAGYRIVYDPRVEVLHYEFGSASSSEQALALQQHNHVTFVRRHQTILEKNHLQPNTPPLFARMTKPVQGRVLIIDDRIPYPFLGSGYPRAAHILKTLQENGWFVTFYPMVYPEGDWHKIYNNFPREVEFMLDHGAEKLEDFLKSRAGYYDAVIVSRPHNMKDFVTHCKSIRNIYKSTKIIYDAEAIFAPREAQRLALMGTPLPPMKEKSMLQEELELARPAQTVITVNERDAAVFRTAHHPDVQVLGHALEPAPTNRPFAERKDLLFVGALDDEWSPNTDSMCWFVHEVMPKLDDLIGKDYRLIVAGRCHAERVQALAGPRVSLLGQVKDLRDLFAATRLFVAPTRYAAGVPHKVHESVANGLPVVATSLLVNQLGWTDGKDILAADDPHTFARQCARLYTDGALWQRLREASLRQLEIDCDVQRFERTLLKLMPGNTHQPDQSYAENWVAS